MNNLRSILLHVDAGRLGPQRMSFARRLAAEHEARLRVMFAALPRHAPNAMRRGPIEMAGPPGWTDADPSRRRVAKARFEQALVGGGWPMEWREAAGPWPVDGFIRQAFHADLLVLGQRDPLQPSAVDVPADFVESVVLDSGRPALILPHHGTLPSDGIRCALVAWQPHKAATRALESALPLLLRCPEVHLVTWSADAEALQPEQQEVIDHLRLHDVTGVQPHGGPVPADVGRSLLSLADGVGADLLVMGCYGSGRLREWVLGGASRTVLRETTLPVLMAH